MKVLVIGGGGREHALVKAIKKSNKVTEIFCSPGNAGIAQDAVCWDVPVENFDLLAEMAIKNKVDLTIVGPEKPLTMGLCDHFEKKDLKIFGPSQAAAQLEGSKAFMKDFAKRHNLPST